MNVPHEKVCIECGSYMTWCKDHYECPECGYVGRLLFRWAKIAAILLLFIGILFWGLHLTI